MKTELDQRRIVIGVLLLICCTLTAAQRPTRTEVGPVPLPKIHAIGDGLVFRQSDNKDSISKDLPPWKKVEIESIFFKKAPKLILRGMELLKL